MSESNTDLTIAVIFWFMNAELPIIMYPFRSENKRTRVNSSKHTLQQFQQILICMSITSIRNEQRLHVLEHCAHVVRESRLLLDHDAPEAQSYKISERTNQALDLKLPCRDLTVQ
jgi:hypothetical protein